MPGPSRIAIDRFVSAASTVIQVFRILFYQPEIPSNTGNVIRLAANTGCELHLVEPLGFSMDAARVRRAGLDYHEFATVRLHSDLVAAWRTLLPARVFAFTSGSNRFYTDVAYAPGDVLFFGPESTGLPTDVLEASEVTDRVRLPMTPSSRSLNLSNATAVAVYEAWRQNKFAGGR